MNKKRKRGEVPNEFLYGITLSFALFLYSFSMLSQQSVVLSPISSQTDGYTGRPYINSTTMSDRLFMDEWIAIFNLDSQSYYRHVVDQRDFKQYLPDSYAVGNDSLTLSKVTLRPKGSGLTVRMLKPTNFSSITIEALMSALATMGADDVLIEVVSPAMTTGQNALAGVFPYFLKTEKDRVRMDLAQREMNWFVYLRNRYKGDVYTPMKINQSLVKTKLSIHNQSQKIKESALRKTLSKHWEESKLPTMTEEDEGKLVEWLLDYQETEAIEDPQTFKILDQIASEGSKEESNDR